MKKLILMLFALVAIAITTEAFSQKVLDLKLYQRLDSNMKLIQTVDYYLKIDSKGIHILKDGQLKHYRAGRSRTLESDPNMHILESPDGVTFAINLKDMLLSINSFEGASFYKFAILIPAEH